MFLVLSLLTAVVLLVLDINAVIHLSYWWIAFIGVSPVIFGIALGLLGIALFALADALDSRVAKRGRK